MNIIIMAGGKGTRIANINSEVPKPMIEILGKPVLQYQIEALHKQGFNDIKLIIGHLGDVIKNYFGDGRKFGVNITYLEEDFPLGTAGALYYLKNELKSDFLLINGDVIFDVNIKKFYEAHKNNEGLVTILTHPNSHPYDSGIIVSEGKRVTKWFSKEDEKKWYKNRVNAGLHFISSKIFRNHFKELKKVDLDRDLLKPLILEDELYLYDSPEYIKDMGTPKRLSAVQNDLLRNIPQMKNLLNKQKAIFIDRDGTINKYVGFMRDIDKFELIEGVSRAIQVINNMGYLAVVISNQPVIARGEVTLEELDEIHNKMETLLGNEGAYLDSIYYCPHHPDKGFENEVIEYKIDCECRKPKSGMIFEAASKLNIDLSESWMIGDSEIDILAGKNAGCKTAMIGDSDKANLSVESLIDFVERIFIEYE